MGKQTREIQPTQSDLNEAALIAMRLLEKLEGTIEAQMHPERIKTLWDIVSCAIYPPIVITTDKSARKGEDT